LSAIIVSDKKGFYAIDTTSSTTLLLILLMLDATLCCYLLLLPLLKCLLLLIASVDCPATGSTELYPYIIKTCIRYVGMHIGEVFLPGLVRY
jgi:hypothetical protein